MQWVNSKSTGTLLIVNFFWVYINCSIRMSCLEDEFCGPTSPHFVCINSVLIYSVPEYGAQFCFLQWIQI